MSKLALHQGRVMASRAAISQGSAWLTSHMLNGVAPANITDRQHGLPAAPSLTLLMQLNVGVCCLSSTLTAQRFESGALHSQLAMTAPPLLRLPGLGTPHCVSCSAAVSCTATSSSCSSLPAGPMRLNPTGRPSTVAIGRVTCTSK